MKLAETKPRGGAKTKTPEESGVKAKIPANLEVNALGIEPRTYGLKVRMSPDVSDGQKGLTARGSGVDPSMDPLCQKKDKEDPQLQEIINRWESLPGPIRAGILAMVRSQV